MLQTCVTDNKCINIFNYQLFKGVAVIVSSGMASSPFITGTIVLDSCYK